MGTRSTIALEYADGTVDEVYCHLGGYLDHNGRILMNHWSNPFKLQELMELGGMSSLGETIGVRRPFGNPYPYGTVLFNEFCAKYKGQCVFYGRDRDEPVTVERFKDFNEYVNKGQDEEYNYILRSDGNWYVSSYDQATHVLLEDAFKDGE